MSIRKYTRHIPFWFNDDFAWVDQWLEPFNSTWTYRGEFVNTDKFDIVPKESYKKELIEAKQKELEANEENRKRLEEELNKLKNS